MPAPKPAPRVRPLLRLGKIDREILLKLPADGSWGEEPLVNEGPRKASMQRSFKRLFDAGLVDDVKDMTDEEWDQLGIWGSRLGGRCRRVDPTTNRVVKLTRTWRCRLTPLGVAVVGRFGDQLRNGERIRWDQFDRADELFPDQRSSSRPAAQREHLVHQMHWFWRPVFARVLNLALAESSFTQSLQLMRDLRPVVERRLSDTEREWLDRTIAQAKEMLVRLQALEDELQPAADETPPNTK